MQTRYKVSLSLLLSCIFLSAHSQHLFGNPSCSDWPQLTVNEKTTWLNAYLVPLNLTNVARKKPKVDKFSQLKSFDSVVLYVDGFCAAHADDSAALGAIRFLDELTAE